MAVLFIAYTTQKSDIRIEYQTCHNNNIIMVQSVAASNISYSLATPPPLASNHQGCVKYLKRGTNISLL